MNRDTYEKLCKMRLPEMASQYRKHAESPELYAAMTFDEEFELLVDAEFDARTNNKIKRLLKNSSIPDTTAHIGGIEFLPERHLLIVLIRWDWQSSHFPEKILIT